MPTCHGCNKSFPRTDWESLKTGFCRQCRANQALENARVAKAELLRQGVPWTALPGAPCYICNAHTAERGARDSVETDLSSVFSSVVTREKISGLPCCANCARRKRRQFLALTGVLLTVPVAAYVAVRASSRQVALALLAALLAAVLAVGLQSALAHRYYRKAKKWMKKYACKDPAAGLTDDADP